MLCVTQSVLVKVNYLADFVVVAMSTFHNYAHADSKLPEYRGRVTDGMFYTELQLPFAPHFNTGNELYVLRATPRFKGEFC